MRISDWSSDVCSSDLLKIVVTPDPFFAARSANAGNHTRMVERVGENHADGENFRERGRRRFVRYITRGKKEPPFLAMEAGKLGFEIDMIARVDDDTARTARHCHNIVQRRLHGGADLGMLAHRQVVVGNTY